MAGVEVKLYEIYFDSETVIGAVKKEPVVRMHEIDHMSPASHRMYIPVAVTPDGRVFMAYTAIFNPSDFPSEARIGRRAFYEINDSVWLGWYADQDYAGKNNAWVQRRNRAILDLIAGLGNLS